MIINICIFILAFVFTVIIRRFFLDKIITAYGENKLSVKYNDEKEEKKRYSACIITVISSVCVCFIITVFGRNKIIPDWIFYMIVGIICAAYISMLLQHKFMKFGFYEKGIILYNKVLKYEEVEKADISSFDDNYLKINLYIKNENKTNNELIIQNEEEENLKSILNMYNVLH